MFDINARAARHPDFVPHEGLLPLPPPDARRRAAARPRLRRILVATDGTERSRGALAVAAALAGRDGAVVEVVSHLPRWGPPPPVHDFLDMTGELLTNRLQRVIPQGEHAFGGRARWSVRLVDGGALAPRIAEVAEAGGHDLIVTGRRDGGVARWLRRPTALAIARATAIPVLAVPAHVTRPPARAVVATGGAGDDLAAARAAARVVAEESGVHLAQSRAVEESVARWAEGAELIALGIQRAPSLEARIVRRIFRAADGCVLLCGAARGELRPGGA
ncbi:MAG TPA: universal stress protein [Gemmatimonadaceae bacterium]|nr:universal stress protein [Gemmatimonadaceae bacterium]